MKMRSRLWRHWIGSAAIAVLAGLWLVPEELTTKAETAQNSQTRSGSAATPPARTRVDFAKEVFPLFQQHCFRCHGSEQQMGKYRLDTKQVALNGGLSAPNIISGKADASPLFQRVSGTGNLNAMPMTGERLNSRDVALLRTWIEEGALWPDDVGVRADMVEKHWAYVKPSRPEPPPVKDAPLIRNAVDNFVLARLQKEGLTFAPEASRETLIRRLSLDLRGLPPTIREIDQFLADSSPKAYEMLVDRMIASTSFGEHWAQHWLDLARYADTNGYESDEPRTMWAYRDWVIAAFNSNLRFDQFTIEQLAGDLLPNPSQGQFIATGFHRNTMINNEAGAKDDEFRDAAVKDRVDTTATVWLGTTLGCAQCHDHKYDPFKQAEYYRFYAFFNNTTESAISTSGEMDVFKGDWQELKRRESQIADLVKILNTETPALKAAQRQWEERIRAQLPSFDSAWKILEPMAMHSNGSKAILERQPDDSILVKGETKADQVYEIEFKTRLPRITGLRVEAKVDNGSATTKPEGTAHMFLSDVDAEVWPVSQHEEQISETNGKLSWSAWHSIGPFRTSSRRVAFSTAYPPETKFDPEEVYENGHLAWIKRPWIDGRVHYFQYLPDTPEENCAHYAFRAVEAREACTVRVSLGSFKGLKLWLNKKLIFVTDPTRDIAPDQDFVVLNLKAGRNEILLKGSNDLGPYGFYFRPHVGLHEKQIHFTAASVDQPKWESVELRGLIDGRKESGWMVGEDGGVAILQANQALETTGTLLKLRLIQDSPDSSLAAPRHFRIAATALDSDLLAELRRTPERLRQALAKPSAGRSSEEAQAIENHFRSIAPELATTRQQHHKLKAELEQFKKLHSTTTLVMKESPQPRKTFRQNRGSFLDLAEVVSPGVPATLHPIQGDKLDRLSLARWLFDESNPLTARVRVNQIWLNIFGRGLVGTGEDFGTQGDLPTHPELLDWLATEFMRLGWDTKALLKTIVTSEVYRQSSQLTPQKQEKDPENKLLSRGARYRLPGETVRDVALASSGLLSHKMGGPSVFPPQPAAVLAEHFVEGGFKQWPTSVGEDRYRRGLYTFYKRTLVYPTFATFDGPDRTVCTVKRARSNTPLQALDTLNDPVFFEAAGSLAHRILAESSVETEDRLTHAFRLVLGRKATRPELERLLTFYRRMRNQYHDSEAGEKVIAAAFPGRRPLRIHDDLTAWIMVANSLLNLDEAVTRE